MIEIEREPRLVSVNFKAAVKYMWVVVLLAVLYAGGSVYMRRRETLEIDRRAEQKSAEADRQADRKIVDELGGGKMKILAFYASPAALHPGQKGLLCYGVASAKAVRIEPGVEPVNPALSRCVEIKPAANTQYKLTATDAGGHAESVQVDVPVR